MSTMVATNEDTISSMSGTDNNDCNRTNKEYAFEQMSSSPATSCKNDETLHGDSDRTRSEQNPTVRRRRLQQEQQEEKEELLSAQGCTAKNEEGKKEDVGESDDGVDDNDVVQRARRRRGKSERERDRRRLRLPRDRRRRTGKGRSNDDDDSDSQDEEIDQKKELAVAIVMAVTGLISIYIWGKVAKRFILYWF